MQHKLQHKLQHIMQHKADATQAATQSRCNTSKTDSTVQMNRAKHTPKINTKRHYLMGRVDSYNTAMLKYSTAHKEALPPLESTEAKK